MGRKPWELKTVTTLATLSKCGLLNWASVLGKESSGFGGLHVIAGHVSTWKPRAVVLETVEPRLAWNSVLCQPSSAGMAGCTALPHATGCWSPSQWGAVFKKSCCEFSTVVATWEEAESTSIREFDLLLYGDCLYRVLMSTHSLLLWAGMQGLKSSIYSLLISLCSILKMDVLLRQDLL